MITEQEQRQIRLLSDTDLYDQACAFMSGIAGPLPPAQINGLLNVSLNDSYDRLKEFIERQIERRTLERHIHDFYLGLQGQLRDLEARALSIIKARTRPVPQDMLLLKMLLAREFIQHVLAENAYMGATRAFPSPEQQNTSNQGRREGNQRGPAPRQGGRRS